MAEEKDNRDLILAYLKDADRTLAWLGRKSGIPYGTLYYSIVRKQFNLNEDNLKKVNDVCGTAFLANSISKKRVFHDSN